MTVTLAELARTLGVDFEGNGGVEISRLNDIQNAGPGEISFISNPRYLKYAETCRASALIVSENADIDFPNVLRVSNPQAVMLKVLQLLNQKKIQRKPGIHESAVIPKDVKIPDSAAIGPHVVIGDHVLIGEEVTIESNTVIGDHSHIGKGTWIKANVTIYNHSQIGNKCFIHSGTVIGSDGFGFVPSEEGIQKIPQTGYVILEDNVEIGSNCAIDRGSIGPTVIGSGTKLDNLVHIAHNVKIGKNCFLTAQVGIAGSTILGDQVQMGGQSGVIGHLHIGNNVSIATRGGVTRDVPDGQTVSGFPAQEHRQELKLEAYIQRLPDLFKTVKTLVKKENKS